jgi:hypothetical protein
MKTLPVSEPHSNFPEMEIHGSWRTRKIGGLFVKPFFLFIQNKILPSGVLLGKSFPSGELEQGAKNEKNLELGGHFPAGHWAGFL